MWPYPPMLGANKVVIEKSGITSPGAGVFVVPSYSGTLVVELTGAGGGGGGAGGQRATDQAAEANGSDGGSTIFGQFTAPGGKKGKRGLFASNNVNNESTSEGGAAPSPANLPYVTSVPGVSGKRGGNLPFIRAAGSYVGVVVPTIYGESPYFHAAQSGGGNAGFGAYSANPAYPSLFRSIGVPGVYPGEGGGGGYDTYVHSYSVGDDGYTRYTYYDAVGSGGGGGSFMRLRFGYGDLPPGMEIPYVVGQGGAGSTYDVGGYHIEGHPTDHMQGRAGAHGLILYYTE